MVWPERRSPPSAAHLRLLQRGESSKSSRLWAALFPCLQSWAETKKTNRIAVLHGPDWVLGSFIKPSCLPERDMVFTAEIKQFLPHSITARTRLWVTKIHDVTHIRILESCSIEKQDMIAVSIL